jgi:hypothetical protein
MAHAPKSSSPFMALSSAHHAGAWCKTQPREFYEKARDFIPNAGDVQVQYMPDGSKPQTRSGGF